MASSLADMVADSRDSFDPRHRDGGRDKKVRWKHGPDKALSGCDACQRDQWLRAVCTLKCLYRVCVRRCSLLYKVEDLNGIGHPEKNGL